MGGGNFLLSNIETF